MLGEADISSTSSLTALGGYTISATPSISGIASVSVASGVIFSADAPISSTVNLTASGHIQGDNWTDVPVGSNIWLRIG